MNPGGSTVVAGTYVDTDVIMRPVPLSAVSKKVVRDVPKPPREKASTETINGKISPKRDLLRRKAKSLNRRSNRKLRRKARQMAKQKTRGVVDAKVKALWETIGHAQRHVSTARRLLYLALQIIASAHIDQKASLPLHGHLVRLRYPTELALIHS